MAHMCVARGVIEWEGDSVRVTTITSTIVRDVWIELNNATCYLLLQIACLHANCMQIALQNANKKIILFLRQENKQNTNGKWKRDYLHQFYLQQWVQNALCQLFVVELIVLFLYLFVDFYSRFSNIWNANKFVGEFFGIWLLSADSLLWRVPGTPLNTPVIATPPTTMRFIVAGVSLKILVFCTNTQKFN